MSRFTIILRVAHAVLVAGVCAVAAPGPAVAQDLSFLEGDMDHYLLNKNSVNQAARVFGFMLSQGATIEIMSQQHPDLAPALQHQGRRFRMTYSFPEERARIVLRNAFADADTDFHAFEADQRAQAVNAVSVNPSRADAEAFVRELESRVSGNMDRMFLAPMLALRFAPDLAGEMQTSTEAFSSAGLPKAMGLNVSLKLPFSWKGEDGNRPHVVQKWTNQDGAGDLFIALLIHDMPGETVTFKHVQELETEGDWSGFAPDGFHGLGGRVIQLDRLPGLQVDVAGASQVLDQQVNFRMRTYMLHGYQKVISLQCMTRGPSEAAAEERFGDLAPLCERVALSFTLPDSYR
jgi:hypothetical protein